MDAALIQRNYIALLYGAVAGVDTDTAEYRYVSKLINHEKLKVEREARRRNLRTVLHSDMKFIPGFISKEVLLRFVDRYCESKNFWLSNGRSLIESFCFFSYCHLNLSDREKFLLLLDGIYSGVSSGEMESPWESEIVGTDGNYTESIKLDYYINIDQLRNISDIKKIVVTPHKSSLGFSFSNDKIRITCKEF